MVVCAALVSLHFALNSNIQSTIRVSGPQLTRIGTFSRPMSNFSGLFRAWKIKKNLNFGSYSHDPWEPLGNIGHASATVRPSHGAACSTPNCFLMHASSACIHESRSLLEHAWTQRYQLTVFTEKWTVISFLNNNNNNNTPGRYL